MNPEPLIPTLQTGLMANAFPGENKRLWTINNRNENKIGGDLLSVDTKRDVHYMEMLHDVALSSKTKDGKTIISDRIEPQEVICIAELPNILNAKLIGQTLKVAVQKQTPDMRVEYFVGADDQEKASKLNLQDGKARTKISGDGNIIVKLFRDKYLLDQVVILR